MRVVVDKQARTLWLLEGARAVLRARVALGREPRGPKRCAGDGRTPEGVYQICLVKAAGKYGQSLGLNYPNAADARYAAAQGLIDTPTLAAIEAALSRGERPPWGTPLGGEIYLHAGGAQQDWTEGCIALDTADMAVLFAYREQITEVEIRAGAAANRL